MIWNVNVEKLYSASHDARKAHLPDVKGLSVLEHKATNNSPQRTQRNTEDRIREVIEFLLFGFSSVFLCALGGELPRSSQSKMNES
jgi:hypothetical protein